VICHLRNKNRGSQLFFRFLDHGDQRHITAEDREGRGGRTHTRNPSPRVKHRGHRSGDPGLRLGRNAEDEIRTGRFDPGNASDAGKSLKQEDIIVAANMGRKAISDMLTTCKVKSSYSIVEAAYVITLGQSKSDNNNRMITGADDFSIVIICKRDL